MTPTPDPDVNDLAATLLTSLLLFRARIPGMAQQLAKLDPAEHAEDQARFERFALDVATDWVLQSRGRRPSGLPPDFRFEDYP
jgi:hypothetical protein